MKRMLLSLLMAVVCSGLFAQSVDKAKDLLKANKFVEAKDEIDKALLLEKNSEKCGSLVYQSKNIQCDWHQCPTEGRSIPDALIQSLDALKNYIQYDDKKQLLIIADGIQTNK